MRKVIHYPLGLVFILFCVCLVVVSRRPRDGEASRLPRRKEHFLITMKFAAAVLPRSAPPPLGPEVRHQPFKVKDKTQHVMTLSSLKIELEMQIQSYIHGFGFGASCIFKYCPLGLLARAGLDMMAHEMLTSIIIFWMW